jgi:hypothetical protein
MVDDHVAVIQPARDTEVLVAAVGIHQTLGLVADLCYDIQLRSASVDRNDVRF